MPASNQSKKNEQPKSSRPFNPLFLGIGLVAVVFIVLLILTLVNLLRTNPYGPELKIDNLSSTYSNLPQDEQDLINAELYTVVSQNLEAGTEIPTSGAKIRQDSATSDYDQTTITYSGNFIVDIPAIEQSYFVQFEWSPRPSGQGLGGYPVLISCLPDDKQIYSIPTTCRDSLSEQSVNWQNEYQINYSFGTVTATKIRDIINEYLISSTSARDYTAVLDETSLTRVKGIEDPTYRFKITLNENATYDIIARTDQLYGEAYIAIYLVNVSDPAKHYAIIKTNDEEAKSTLTSWFQDIALTDTIEINYENL